MYILMRVLPFFEFVFTTVSIRTLLQVLALSSVMLLGLIRMVSWIMNLNFRDGRCSDCDGLHHDIVLFVLMAVGSIPCDVFAVT